MPDRTGRPSAGECLDPEVLSAYVDGKLDVRERAEVEAHLASCADCYEVMSEVLHIHEAIPAAHPVLDAAPDVSALVHRPSGDIVVRGAFGRRKAVWGVAGGLLAAAAALVLVVRLQPTWWTGGVDPKLADLVEAVGEERTVEARLTGGFKYGPLRSPMRSGGRVGPTDNWSLLAAAGRIREIAEKDPTPENLHTLGVAHLVLGEYDEALRVLNLSTAESPTARALADLAAAYTSRANALAKADDWPQALAAADRATDVDESLLEARFNRALALEGLGLAESAIVAFEDYLERDNTSEWAKEARRHLADLRSSGERSAAEPTPLYRTRERAEVDLLEEWALAVREARDPQATVSELRAVADALTQRGNHLLSDAVDLISIANPAKIKQIAEGHVAYSSAVRLYDSERVVDSASLFELAAKRFRRSRSPFYFAAAMHLAAIRYYRGDRFGAEAEGRRLLAAIPQHRYPVVESRLNWLLGLMQTVAGQYEGAIETYRLAHEAAQAQGEIELVAFLDTLLGEVYSFVGDHRSAWSHRRASLLRLDEIRIPRRQSTVLINAAIAANRQGLPSVALEFHDAAVGVANRHEATLLKFEGLLYRARALVSMDRLEQARSDIAESENILPTLPEALRARMAVEVLVSKALLPDSDSDMATEAARYLDTTGAQARLPVLYALRARAERRAGRDGEAVIAYQAALRAASRATRTLAERFRLSYSDEIWPIVDEVIEFALEDGRATDALQTLRSAQQPLVGYAEEADRQLPTPAAGTAVVCLLLGREAAYAIVAFAGATNSVRLPLDATSLALRILPLLQRLQGSSSNEEAALRAKLTDLHDVLVRPWLSLVPGVQRLIIAPTGLLAKLPFHCLRDRATGRFLIEDFELSVAPSLAAIPEGDSSAFARGRELSVLAVGVTAVTARWQLSDLPAAESEAKAVAGLYSRATVLSGSAASPEIFASAIQLADVIHFSGHSLPSQEFAQMGILLMAPDHSHPTGALFAHEIAELHLRPGAVVFLSSCESGVGTSLRSEGSISLARAFVQGGASSVVATLWKVRDQEAGEFSRKFHGVMASTGSAVNAVRTVQLDAIAAGLSLSHWAAFVAFGA